MDVVHERCAGIDISKADVKECVRTPSRNRRRHSAIRTFSAHDGRSAGDAGLADRPGRDGGRDGGHRPYWKPVFYLLESQMTCWLLNAQQACVGDRRVLPNTPGPGWLLHPCNPSSMAAPVPGT
jgi:transposase